MFEERTEKLRKHIAYLTDILAEESADMQEVDSEELRSFLESCQEEIEELKSDLPYDEIDDDDIPIEDFEGENLEDSEIEDEVVEVEGVIQELQQLMEAAAERFFEDKELFLGASHSPMKSSNLSESEFRQKLEGWLTKEIKNKYETEGVSKGANEIAAMCKSIIESASTNKVNPFPHFSVALFHVTLEMLNDYNLMGGIMNFDNSLRLHCSLWMPVK